MTRITHAFLALSTVAACAMPLTSSGARASGLVGVQIKTETFTASDGAAIARAGFAFVRLGVWIEHERDSVYMSRVASAFAIAADAKLPVLLTLRSTVPMFDVRTASRDDIRAAGERFGASVQSIVHRFGSQLIAVELWNEPDVDRYWPSGDVTATFPLFVQGVCAQLGSSKLPVPVYGFGFSRAPIGDGVAQRLLLQSPRCIDGVSYHAYGMTPAQMQDAARDVRARYGLPLVITEWGVPTVGAPHVDPAAQARRTAVFLASLRAIDVPLASIYEWRDTSRAANLRERSFGLIDANGIAKPALAVAKDYLAHPRTP